MADDIYSGVRTAEGARGTVKVAEENGLEAAGAVPAEITCSTVVVGADEDMIDPETADTRLIGPVILPGVDYMGGRRRSEELGASAGVLAPRRRRRWWRREAARVWGLRLVRESATNMFIACLNT
jgi:hypothetical protein